MRKIIYYLFLIFFLQWNIYAEGNPKEEKSMQMAIRLTTDHIFRGYNYAMLASDRNNTPYSSVNFVPAVQPQFVYATPLKGLKTLFWSNFFITNLKDRDSDFAILQDGPGQTDRFASILSEMVNNSSAPAYNPYQTRSYRERNSLGRYDGIFFGVYYEWKTTFGEWSIGTWIWNNLNRFGKYTWQEYFIWYNPPVFKEANIKIQFFLNTSFDNGGSANSPMGITNAQNYLSIESSHTFFKDKGVEVTPSIVVGYVQNNDNISKRAGISNAVTSLKFSKSGYDLTFHVLYRPAVLLYDTSDKNKSDGKLPDPEKQIGYVNKYVYNEIGKVFPSDIANYLNYEMGSKKIINTVFIISMGYSWEF
ncbi:MAG: hypothetical protein H7A23_21180 [Leptospiraceae bacterium]|nr:hypothetical protein [Leptospiraceae bacterium]MCP5497077.1 hypothetical protein [Leptospiraceae bacterium]